jgi:hypothetical protein
MKVKEPKITKAILKKNKVGSFTVPDPRFTIKL